MQGVQILQSQVQSGTSRLSEKPIFIFLAPPSVDELEKRLRGRGTETEESLSKRLEAAKREMDWGLKPGSVDLVILNDDVEVAYTALRTALVG
jgi:guanylate kinase